MKIRTGFVSNSSSSSFVCDLCKREEEGHELSRNEAEMITLPKNDWDDYCICEDHLPEQVNVTLPKEELLTLVRFIDWEECPELGKAIKKEMDLK